MKVLVPDYYRKHFSDDSFRKNAQAVAYFSVPPPRKKGRLARMLEFAGQQAEPVEAVVKVAGAHPGTLSSAEGAVLGWNMGARELLAILDSAPKLRWVHVMQSGVDHLPLELLASREITVTSCKGLRTEAVAEYAMGLIYLFAKRYLEHVHSQAVLRSKCVHGSTVCILGTGAIGKKLAEIAGKNGMRVFGVNRTGRDAEFFSATFPRESYAQAVGEADFVVCCLPLTSDTADMVNAEFLGKCKKEACVINVARDKCVDGHALLQAIESGHISRAALDIEPTRKDGKLASHPKVLLTKHSAHALEKEEQDVVARLASNVSRFLQGEGLAGEVSLELGY